MKSPGPPASTFPALEESSVWFPMYLSRDTYTHNGSLPYISFCTLLISFDNVSWRAFHPSTESSVLFYRYIVVHYGKVSQLSLTS